MPDHMTTMRLGAVSLALVIAGAVNARATDVLIAGKSLTITAKSASVRKIAFRSEVDPAIAPPFVDPTLGAFLRVFVGSGPGQCHAEITLPAGFWSPIGGDGPQRGWRYRDPTASAQGIRTVKILKRQAAGGQIVIKGRGAFPCGIESQQEGKMHVELRLSGLRYCAGFGGVNGGTVRAFDNGKFHVLNAAAPSACLRTSVTVATLNVLHGIFCPGATDGCRRVDRVDLLRDFVVARGCPDVLAFQEVSSINSMVVDATLLHNTLLNACISTTGPYEDVYHNANSFDDEMVFSRYPILEAETHDLLGPLRNVLRVRIDHPIGAVDVYTTHLASGSDSGNAACGSTFGPCPAECIAAGAATIRDCQGIQMIGIINATHDVPTPAFAVGDFNVEPGSFVYDAFEDQGWVDTYLQAGLPECDDVTGIGCTSGRIDDALTDMESPALGQVERIDFIWLIPPGPGSICSGDIEGAGDPDGDGVATRLFADEPNPFSPTCGPAPDPICWSSDHTGVQADVNCLF